ncbi:MAG: hypothetical protein IPG87_12835 [Saprospiraceae bacterium]|nr:hypothetical protein [Candidatus Vicinibacter affinis]
MKTTACLVDSPKFKVPTLRNIEFYRPYMHDGRFKNPSGGSKTLYLGFTQSKTLSEKLKNSIAPKSK